MHLYIYYEVPFASRTEAAARVRAMQAALPLDPAGVRFLKRPSSATHAETWMEVYEDVDPSFEAVLDAAVAAHGIADLTTDRHVERFADHDR
jgi:hypothetical protein